MKILLTFIGTFLPSGMLLAAGLFPITLPWNDGSNNALSVAFLNDHVAGSRGFISVNSNAHLANSAGRIRFMGTNLAGGSCFPSPTDAPGIAKRLSKFGINLVRFHNMDNAWGGATIWQNLSLDRTLDPVSLDRLDRLVYELKQQGIYANFNLMVGRPFKAGTELHPDINLIADGKERSALGFFDPAQQALHRQYASDLLTHVNPYTGTAYINEPAIAFVEINNENGLIHAFKSQILDNLPPYYMSMLNTQWNTWLQARYANQAALNAAWAVTIVPPVPTNALTNGDFTAPGIAPWTYQLAGSPPATGSATVVAGIGPSGTAAVQLNVATAGQAAWQVSLIQAGLNVVAGTPYTFKYWAKADQARNFDVSLIMATSPWSNLGFSVPVSVDTTWKYFEYTFTPSQSFGNARINFANMGLQAGATFDIAQVDFREGGTLGLYPDEVLATGTMRNYVLGDTSRTANGKRDWIEFLRSTEDSYWTMMRDYVKTTLGYSGVVQGTTLFTNMPSVQGKFDAADTHYYWSHPIFPSIPFDQVDWYEVNTAMVDNPATSGPAELSTQALLGRPFTVTEFNDCPVNVYENEGLLSYAAYAALQHWDAIYVFDFGAENDWATTQFAGQFRTDANPGKMAALPAAALLFRRADAAPANQLVSAILDDATEATKLVTANTWRMLNLTDIGADPREGLVHRLRLGTQGQTIPPGALAPGSTAMSNDLLSDTGELRWQSPAVQQGRVTADTDRTKAAIGFLAGQNFVFKNLTISAVSGLVDGGFGSIALSSLDGLSLTASTHLLLTVLGGQSSTGRNHYIYPNTPTTWPPPYGSNITSKNEWGPGPALVEGLSATLELPFTPGQLTAWSLDKYGNRKASLPVVAASGGSRIDVNGSYQVLWYELVVNHASYSPTATPTNTPNWTATPTLTPTPSATPSSEWPWNDFEGGEAPQAWQAFADTVGGAAILGMQGLSNPALCAQGTYCHEFQFNTGPPASWGGGISIDPRSGKYPAGYKDVSGAAYLEIWLYTDTPGLSVQVNLDEAGSLSVPLNGGDGERFLAAGGTPAVLSAGWNQLVYPISGFIDNPSWPYTPSSLGNNTLDLQALKFVSLSFSSNQGANVTLRVDQVTFTLFPAPFPSPTATVTATASVTPFLTSTPSPSISPSTTASPTASETPTSTFSPSPTSLLTFSVTPTLTASATHSSTATPSPTSSPSKSITPTFSYTPAVSPTDTPSASPSFSVTSTFTSTFTPTLTPTMTATSSLSPSFSITLTKTSNLTPVNSASPTLTASVTVTAPASATLSITPSPTLSRTPNSDPAGQGTLTISPMVFESGQPGTIIKLIYTAGSSAFVNGTLVFTIPAGWPAPQNTDTQAPAYVELNSQGNISAINIAGQTVMVDVAGLSPGASVTLSYGAGPKGLTAPQSPGQYNFSAASDPLGMGSPQATGAPIAVQVVPYQEQPLVIEEAVAAPNPMGKSGGSIHVKLAGGADKIKLRIYSTGMTVIAEKIEQGPFRHWSRVALPPEVLSGLANGVYYLAVSAGRQESWSKPKIVKMMVLK